MNLATRYPKVYWNTACLAVNSGSADEESDKDNSTDYGKIASSMGAMKSRGVNISLPDINNSDYGFKPDVKNNSILYGLKGLNSLGDDMVKMIIENRPYESLEHFLEVVGSNKEFKLNKTQIAVLVKSGAFDELEKTTREKALMKYINLIADKKKRVTMQNFNMMIGYKMIPEELDWERRVFNYNKFIRHRSFKRVNENGDIFFALNEQAQAFHSPNFGEDDYILMNGEVVINKAVWHPKYTKQMDPARAWVKKNKDALLEELNDNIANDLFDKYGQGTVSAWEMEALSFYYHNHELEDVKLSDYGCERFHDLPEEPKVVGESLFNGRKYPIYDLTRIVGTVIDKNKYRHTVTLLTTTGVCHVKFYGGQFSAYDKQISTPNGDGTKSVLEKGWFTKGNKIMITGFRRDDQFIPKKYRNTGGHTVYIIDEVTENNELVLRGERRGSV